VRGQLSGERGLSLSLAVTRVRLRQGEHPVEQVKSNGLPCVQLHVTGVTPSAQVPAAHAVFGGQMPTPGMKHPPVPASDSDAHGSQ
jgi:hypothetical protein